MANARLRLKHSALIATLTGRFDDHHAFLWRIILRRSDDLSAMIEEMTGQIETELALLHDAVERLATVPGVDLSAAAVILAETGRDMTGFPRQFIRLPGPGYARAATNPRHPQIRHELSRETRHSGERWVSRP
jgi:transposase